MSNDTYFIGIEGMDISNERVLEEIDVVNDSPDSCFLKGNYWYGF